MIRVKRILYPTDFSSYSNQAYFHALGLAEAYQAALTMVYVCPKEQLDQKAYWMAQLESIRPSNPRIPVSHVLLTGDPADEIIRYSADAGIDVIVIGTHGLSALERQQMGSVAEQVMRRAACTVLVVKLQKGSPQTSQPHVQVMTL